MKVSYSVKNILSKVERSFVDKAWETEDRQVYGAAYNNHIWNEEAYIVAKDSKELAGFAFLEYEGGVMWLAELLVFEKYRGKGVGYELLTRVVDFAKAQKCHKIILETNIERQAAVTLYERFGFKIEARLPNHYAHRESILMSTFLDH